MATINLFGEPCVLHERLGAGGMGTVYSAEHRVEGQLAVKLLQPELRDDPLLVARIRDEALAGRRVDHPNVVRVLASGVADDGVPFLAMRRVAGVSLGQVLHEHGPLALERVRAIAIQILTGLDAIHRAGLVHGDLKSDNILVDACDRAVIIDFGLARAPRTRLREDEQLISGTPDYMAPELIRGKPITTAADIYAIGVILYELVTGSTPFAAPTTARIFHGHLEDEVVPPSLRCPGLAIPLALDEAICAALAKNPEDRPATAMLLRALVARAIPKAWCETIRLPRADVAPMAPTRRWPRGSMPIDNVTAEEDECGS